MSDRSHARLATLVLLAWIPLAVAEPALPTAIPSGTLPEQPTVPQGTVMNINEHGLTFQGRVESPTLVRVLGPDGKPAIEYRVDDAGRARLDIAGENVVRDGTLIRIEGNPLADAFTLIVANPSGDATEVVVDRNVLRTNVGLPPELQLDAVAIERPPTWPWAPSRSYLHYIRDADGNTLDQGELRGGEFLQRLGNHRAVLQIPRDDLVWDRMVLEARLAGSNVAPLVATFAATQETETALVYAATFTPTHLGAGEGDTIEIDVYYERRFAPMVADRIREPATHRYKVDGAAPTVTIQAPTESSDFKFGVSWSGQDGLSGLKGFTVDYREAGSSSWIRWLTQTPDKTEVFSGEWGRTYELRVAAVDAVGNPSTQALATTRVVSKPANVDDVNDAPIVRMTSPRSGATVNGLVTVAWEASDPDGTPITSKLEVSDDDGASWRTIYVGRLTTVKWDTTRETDGADYRLRVVASDGTLSASDVASALTVHNVLTASSTTRPPETPAVDPTTNPPANPATPTPAQTGGSPTGATPPAEPEEERDTPAPFVGIAIGLAALIAARRRRA